MATVETYCIWVFITLALQCSLSFAYGSEGHEIIARIADSMLSSKAKSSVDDLLKNDPDNSLKKIGSWADIEGRRGLRAFTKNYHFYKSQYNPNSLCETKQEMKCPESGCVMDAVSYYALVLANEALPQVERERALKYLVHFMGDIHQPLHLTERLGGGSNAKVVFEGNKDLHKVWDSSMIKKRIADDFGGDIEKYFQYFQEKLSRNWKSELHTWRNCQYQAHPSSEKLGVCSTQWAYEAHILNCRGVWSNVKEGTDVSKEYYQNFKQLEMPEKFLAKAGVRLALILENIFGDKPRGKKKKGKANPVETEQLPKYLENFANREREAKAASESQPNQPEEDIPDIHESEFLQDESVTDKALYKGWYQGLNDEQDEMPEEQEEQEALQVKKKEKKPKSNSKAPASGIIATPPPENKNEGDKDKVKKGTDTASANVLPGTDAFNVPSADLFNIPHASFFKVKKEKSNNDVKNNSNQKKGK